MAPLLEVRDLVKTFPVPKSDDSVWAVNQVSFEIKRGEILGLVGESGSGKTTVGRCVLRLIEPTSGEVQFDGRAITSLSSRELRELRPRIQAVFQDPYQSLDPNLTAFETIEEPIIIWEKLKKGARRARVAEYAQMVGLTNDQLDSYPHQLSGGHQQRVGIARALACRPAFLVLDEATSALDPTVRASIIDLLIKLKAELDLSYLLISHDLTAVRHVCDRVAVMYLGKIVEVGPVDQIFDQPRHPYTRALMSSALFPDPDLKRPVITLEGEIPSPIHLPKGCFLEARCPISQEQCGSAVPELIEYEEGQAVACYRADEVAAGDFHELNITPTSARGSTTPKGEFSGP